MVESVCERLDGIPLALELAAARCGQLGLDGVSNGLDDRFRLLTGGRRRVARQQTLEATLDWSYDLLAPHEQASLRSLAVFVGGFTPGAAKRVAATTVDGLADLVEKSLVQRDGHRFRLLETVRTYAEERLQRAGEAAQVRGRHLDWLVDHVGEVDPFDVWFHQERYRERMNVELDNAVAALDWAISCGRWSDFALLAAPFAALKAYLVDPGYNWVAERLDRALSLAEPGPDRSRLLTLRLLAGGIGMDPMIRDKALDVADSNDPWEISALLLYANSSYAASSFVADDAGIERATMLFARAEQLAGDDHLALSMAKAWQGTIAMTQLDWDLASSLFDEAFAERARAGVTDLSHLELVTYGITRQGAGRGWPLSDAAAVSVDFYGLPISGEFFMAASTAPGPERPTRPFDADISKLIRYSPVAQTTVMIQVLPLGLSSGSPGGVAWAEAVADKLTAATTARTNRTLRMIPSSFGRGTDAVAGPSTGCRAERPELSSGSLRAERRIEMQGDESMRRAG